jgi:hypothetical protein
MSRIKWNFIVKDDVNLSMLTKQNSCLSKNKMEKPTVIVKNLSIKPVDDFYALLLTDIY